MEKIKLWWRVLRPNVFFASACPVLVGVIVTPQPRWFMGLLTLLCAMALQSIANLVNDYFDFKRGADTAGRSGPERMLAEGQVNESQMRKAIVVAFVVAVLLGGALVWQGGWPILIVGVLSLLFAWFYTATAHSLSYTGIADIVCFLFYGGLATFGTFWLQTHFHFGQLVPDAADMPAQMLSFACSQEGLRALLSGSVCGCIAVCILETNNIRDIDDDSRVDKKTLVVRFGKRFGEWFYLFNVVLMPLFAFFAFKGTVAWWVPCLILLPALLLYAKVLKAQGKEYNLCLANAAKLNALYALLVLVWRVVGLF